MRRSDGLLARGLSVALAASIATASLPAWGTDKEVCVGAAETAQRLKKAHKLLAAREQLLVCSSRECPSIVSNDCTSWLGEVERSMASVVVHARDGRGRPVYDVRVLLDGNPFAPQASGTPLDVDPGPHVFRCLRGDASVDVQATLAEGERGHAIVCDMPTPVTVPPPPSSALPGEVAPPVPPPASQPDVIPWPSWVLGGVGILALGSAAIFGVTELTQQSADAAPGGCKPHCSDAEISSIQTKIDLAYASAGVAVLALGAAVVIALIHPKRAGAGVGQLPQVFTPLSPW